MWNFWYKLAFKGRIPLSSFFTKFDVREEVKIVKIGNVWYKFTAKERIPLKNLLCGRESQRSDPHAKVHRCGVRNVGWLISPKS